MQDDLFDRDGDEERQERHGEGVLVLRGGQPDRAAGCLLPDGQITDAVCLAAQGEEQVWARKVGPKSQWRRRGQLIVQPGVALLFMDEADLNFAPGCLAARPSLERDLYASRYMQCDTDSLLFAMLLFLALHHVTWRHDNTGEEWSCTRRRAGEIIDRLRGDAGFDIWHLMIYEQTLDALFLDEDVIGRIAMLGWTPILDDTDAE